MLYEEEEGVGISIRPVHVTVHKRSSMAAVLGQLRICHAFDFDKVLLGTKEATPLQEVDNSTWEKPLLGSYRLAVTVGYTCAGSRCTSLVTKSSSGALVLRLNPTCVARVATAQGEWPLAVRSAVWYITSF